MRKLSVAIEKTLPSLVFWDILAVVPQLKLKYPSTKMEIKYILMIQKHQESILWWCLINWLVLSLVFSIIHYLIVEKIMRNIRPAKTKNVPLNPQSLHWGSELKVQSLFWKQIASSFPAFLQLCWMKRKFQKNIAVKRRWCQHARICYILLSSKIFTLDGHNLSDFQWLPLFTQRPLNRLFWRSLRCSFSLIDFVFNSL